MSHALRNMHTVPVSSQILDLVPCQGVLQALKEVELAIGRIELRKSAFVSE